MPTDVDLRKRLEYLYTYYSAAANAIKMSLELLDTKPPQNLVATLLREEVLAVVPPTPAKRGGRGPDVKPEVSSRLRSRSARRLAAQRRAQRWAAKRPAARPSRDTVAETAARRQRTAAFLENFSRDDPRPAPPGTHAVGVLVANDYLRVVGTDPTTYVRTGKPFALVRPETRSRNGRPDQTAAAAPATTHDTGSLTDNTGME
jgi:hypothetical protein